MSLLYSDILNNYVNIFTDASIKKIDNNYIGCFGAIVVIGKEIIDQSCRIITNTTNNNSEIKAIREGIVMALKYRERKPYINLFSDSQICIFGLRDRLLKWSIENNHETPSYYGSQGQLIINQDVFAEIASLILDYNLHINLLHQAGHVNFKANSMRNALHVFRASNNIRDTIDINIIRYISTYNNYVDNMTRNMLHNVTKCDTISPISFYANREIDRSKYKDLTVNRIQYQ